MNIEKTQIDICVGTFKRPQLLSLLLQSLEKQELNNQLNIRIIIIDNDSEQSGKTTVDEFRKTNTFEVVYDVEPEKGISFVRNRALQHVQTEYFAFLDDDEVAEKDWLLTLYRASIKYEADAVFGPVVGILPDEIPEWALNHQSFTRPRKNTGTLVQSGGTGNVLVKTQSLGVRHQKFDITYALTGGEDSDFFYRLYLAEKKLVWCNEAIVREHIPQNRISVSWVRLRAFRGGQCFQRTFVQRYTLRKKIIWLLQKPLQFIAGLISLPFARIYSYPLYVRLLCRTSGAAGQLTGAVNLLEQKEYAENNIFVDASYNIEKKIK